MTSPPPARQKTSKRKGGERRGRTGCYCIYHASHLHLHITIWPCGSPDSSAQPSPSHSPPSRGHVKEAGEQSKPWKPTRRLAHRQAWSHPPTHHRPKCRTTTNNNHKHRPPRPIPPSPTPPLPPGLAAGRPPKPANGVERSASRSVGLGLLFTFPPPERGVGKTRPANRSTPCDLVQRVAALRSMHEEGVSVRFCLCSLGGSRGEPRGAGRVSSVLRHLLFPYPQGMNILR